ncbi:MAG TPA: xanthine dehydrogenase accessory protein XdhC, partial [Woeseiaceae bacterium]|nr:xanthine dehydrogenase accessory protein XdhC [Woeseiaceae bacterium]
WIQQMRALRAERSPLVLVTVAGVRGSAPREVGAKMIVTRQACSGSIGGGQLEYQCAGIAAELLRENARGFERGMERGSVRENAQGNVRDVVEPVRFRRRFPLGANLGQCCGGVVEVLFEKIAGECRWFDELLRLYGAREPVVLITSLDERYLVSVNGIAGASRSAVPPEVLIFARDLLRDPHRGACSVELSGQPLLFEPVREAGMNIAIFGAGHVGSASVAALSAIDCHIRWIDSRRNIFPDRLPDCVSRVECTDPVLEVAAMPTGSYYLIMTHSHSLDYAICHRVLQREDVAYCGLIGSLSKRRRFEKLMRDAGLPPTALERLTCPIGIAGIRGKKPAEIAIALAAELLETRDAHLQAQGYDRRRPPLTVVSDRGGK